MLFPRLSFVLGLIVCGFYSVPQIAGFETTIQERNAKGPAYTSPPDDDLTYPLMGEFFGTIKTTNPESGKKKTELLGLQIRSTGNDSFDAIAFLGGLPGHKKHLPDPIRMIGKRSGDFVVLSGGPWAIFVEKNTCQLLDRTGNKIGQLKRIRRKSPTMYASPPDGATVLFDGSNTDQFVNAEMTPEGLLMEGADVKPMFQDFNLHVEFRLPYMPVADDQKRANSGLYLQSRYECQVLDSFAQTPKINGCGALYQFKKPDLNMCFPPLVWQTYDVHFTAPRWAADGTKIRNAHISSWVNGIKVQDDVALPNKTGAGKQEAATLLPMKIQDHGDPVRFRNIWVVDRGLSTSAFPVIPSKADVQAAIKLEQQARQKRAKAERKKLAEARKKAAAAAKAIQADNEKKAKDSDVPMKTDSDNKPDKSSSDPVQDPAEPAKKPQPKPKVKE